MTEYRSIEKLDRLTEDDNLTLARFRREGERLGSKNIPLTNQSDLSDFEASEIKACTELLKTLEKEVESFQSDAQIKIEKLSRDLDNELPNKQTEILDEADAELDKVETDLGIKSAVFENVDKEFNEVNSNLKEVRRTLGNRELQISLVNIYFPFMVCLALAEVSVNRLAFELFFAGSPLSSILLAVAVGAMLIFFAHITGVSLKRNKGKSESGEKLNTLMAMCLLNVLVGIFIYYLAKMRQAFVSLEQSQDIKLEDIFSSEEAEVMEGVLGNSGGMDSIISTSIGSEGFFLLLVNVVVYVAGFVAAILRHDSHPDYEKLTTLSNKLSNKRVLLKKRYQNRHSQVMKRKQEKMSALRTTVSETKGMLNELEIAMQKSETIVDVYKDKLNIAINNKLMAFRQANKQKRTDTAPKYFSNKIEL